MSADTTVADTLTHPCGDYWTLTREMDARADDAARAETVFRESGDVHARFAVAGAACGVACARINRAVHTLECKTCKVHYREEALRS